MNRTPAAPADGWANLLSGRHLATVLVMASGVLLYAMNLYFTAALMPSIVADIGGQPYYAWVTTAFVISAIVASLFVSRILQWQGPAFAYLVAFIAFALGAAVIAASPSMALLIAGRVVQGLGGGLLAGLGGVFAELGLWRWSYAALAVGALVLCLPARHAFARMAGSGHRSAVPVASLIPLILATLAISLSAIVPIGWPTLAMVAIGLALLVLFVIVERREKETILPHITYRRGNTLKWVYLTVAALSAGVMVENFIPLFGQQLAGLSPLIAGFLGAVLSLAWVIAQLLVVSVKGEAGRRRVIRLGPLLLTAGLMAYGLLQVAAADTVMVLIWVAVLALAGAGIGLAWPLLGVAAMRSSDDPAEAGKAAAAITITQLIAFSITSALAGTLLAAGGDAMVDAARYVTLGIAFLTLLGIYAAGVAARK